MKVKTFYQVCVVFPDLNFLKKNLANYTHHTIHHENQALLI